MSMHGNNNSSIYKSTSFFFLKVIYKSTRTWKNMNANVAFIGPCNRA